MQREQLARPLVAEAQEERLKPPLTCTFGTERAKGIEPSFSAWEADRGVPVWTAMDRFGWSEGVRGLA